MASNGELSSFKMAMAFFPLVLVIGLKKLNIPEEDLLIYSRFSMAVRIALELMIFIVVYLKLKNIPEGAMVPRHQKSVGFGQTESVAAMSSKDYDNQHFFSLLKQEGLQIVLLLVMHIKFGFVQPLLISSIVSVLKLFDSEIVKLYLLGLSPERYPSLKRPFGGATIEEEKETDDNSDENSKDKKETKKETKKEK